MMEWPAIQGILLGLTLAVLLGPAFFSLIQTSMHRGFRSGVFLAFGIFLSDLALVALCYLGATQVIQDPQNKMMFGILASIILIAFGLVTFTRNPIVQTEEEDEMNRTPGIITYILKGFFLNIANPFVILFWMGVMGFVSGQYGVDRNSVFSFFTGTLLTVFSTDIIKSFIADKIQRFLDPRIMTWVNRIVGISLMIFGVVLMVRVLQVV